MTGIPRARSYVRFPLTTALVGLLLVASFGTALAADTTVLTVDSPGSKALSGAATLTGIAVNCTTGQAATRVSMYDGEQSTGIYIQDVSMDTVRDLSGICSPVPSGIKAGFTIIFDTNRLANAAHTLTFVATFPGGGTATAKVNVTISNAPRVSVYSQPYAVTSYGTVIAGNLGYYPGYINPLGTVYPYVASGVTPYIYPSYVNSIYNPLYNPFYSGYYSGLTGYYPGYRRCTAVDYRGLPYQYVC